ncbi:MAG: hypothetical protein IKS41_06050 [Alphaproteobacteria bacterium]|nr:hypothetical protein [Alphaproteobacteria bacterium]
MINNRLTRLLEAIPNLLGNSTLLFPQRTRTPVTDIEKYPFSEKPLFLFIYHPFQLIDLICRRRCTYPIGHIASVYKGVCIDTVSDFFTGLREKGFFRGMIDIFKTWYNGRNKESIGVTLRRIVRAKQSTKPFIFLLFPKKMGLSPFSLKQRMMMETLRVDDYCFLGNNCATHSLRPILGKAGLQSQFGNVITPKEVLGWCDGLCDEGKAIRISNTGLSDYLAKLQPEDTNNLFGEASANILSNYLRKRQR